MPLVPGGEREPLDRSHEQARKIHPRYAKGELVRVAVARNLAEAELIKGVLLEQGIPSLLRRTAGFDVPDFLAAGPRDVLVPEAGVEEARALLSDVDADHAELGALPPGWEQQAVDAGEPAPSPGEGLDPSADRQPLGVRAGAWLLVVVLAFGALAGVVVALVLR